MDSPGVGHCLYELEENRIIGSYGQVSRDSGLQCLEAEVGSSSEDNMDDDNAMLAARMATRRVHANVSRIEEKTPRNSHIIGLDSWAQRSLTATESLLHDIHDIPGIEVQGHTRACVERVTKEGINKYFGTMLYYPNATATILSQRDMSNLFFITYFNDGKNCQATDRVNRKIIFNFSMNIPGYEGVLACDVNDKMWEQIIQPPVYGRLKVFNSIIVQTMLPPGTSNKDYLSGLRYIRIHRVLGHTGSEQIIRTSRCHAIDGLEEVTEKMVMLGELIMGGKCPICAAVNVRKTKRKLDPQAPAITPIKEATPSDEIPEVEDKSIKSTTIGFDIAYLNKRPFLIAYDSVKGYGMIEHLFQDKRTEANILKAVRRVVSEYRHDAQEVLEFAHIYMDLDIQPQVVLDGHIPQAMESDGEPGLIKGLTVVAQEMGMQVVTKVAGSHVAQCERFIREVRRKQAALVIGIPYVLTPVMILWSFVEAAVICNLVCKKGTINIPFTSMTGRRVHFDDLACVQFGDAIMAMKRSMTVGNSRIHNELGIVLGHLLRTRHGVAMASVVTGQVKPRTRYFRIFSIDLQVKFGRNPQCIHPVRHDKSIEQYMMRTSQSSQLRQLTDRELINVFTGTDPEYSPGVTRERIKFGDRIDEMDEDAEFDAPGNLRRNDSVLVEPENNGPGDNEQVDMNTRLEFVSPSNSGGDGFSVEANEDLNWRGDTSDLEDNRTFQQRLADRPQTPVSLELDGSSDLETGLLDEVAGDDNDMLKHNLHDDLIGDNVEEAAAVEITTTNIKERLPRQAKNNSYVMQHQGRNRNTRGVNKNVVKVAASVANKGIDKDVPWDKAVERWGTDALESQEKEAKQLAVEYQVFEPTKKGYHEVEAYFRSRAFTEIKSDGTFKSRIIVTLEANKKGTPMDFKIDCYSPTLDLKLFFCMLSICAELELELNVWDVKGAYFKTYMNRSGVYVKLNVQVTNAMVKLVPEWRIFVKPDGTMLVECVKAWYGTKPAAALWNRDIHKVIVDRCGYQQHSMVPCIYFRRNPINNEFSFMLLHVDDIGAMMPRDGKERDRVKTILECVYSKLKVTREEYIGLHVEWDKNNKRFSVDMNRYISKLVKQYRIAVGVRNPNTNKERIWSKDESLEINQTEYRSIIGQLRYIGQLIGGAALYPISILSTRQNNPTIGDYNDAIRVLKYFYHIRERKILISGYGQQKTLHIWADASFANHADGKSQQGILIKIGNCPGAIYVGSWKQSALATSVGNAEVMCLGTASQYGRYFMDVLSEFGDEFKFDVVYYEDNKSCYDMVIGTAHGNVMKEKFMKVRINYLHEYINDVTNKATCVKVPTNKQLADSCTKAVYGKQFLMAEMNVYGDDEYEDMKKMNNNNNNVELISG